MMEDMVGKSDILDEGIYNEGSLLRFPYKYWNKWFYMINFLFDFFLQFTLTCIIGKITLSLRKEIKEINSK